jgi:type VI secretion system secreted protein VgrG
MTVSTPLGKDTLLLVGFSGHEGISQLYSFQLDLIAENKTDVAFDKLLGQKVTVTQVLPKGKKRYFNGLCSRFMQGARDDKFTAYQMEIVPQFWLLTRRVQSRIFQHISVVDILKKVLTGLDVTYEINGSFAPRDFCVQYRESDFNFASRLMEEEGIYYFFKHADGSHKMVLANTPGSHPDMPEGSKFIFERHLGGTRTEERIDQWQKVQELRSGKYTLWDHCFELPHKHLEADKTIQESVAAGKVNHKLKVGGNDKLEIYDYPGAYAQRFDGIDKGGGEKPADVQKIFEDNKRTVGIRMQEETVPGLVIQGGSNCRNLVSGHKFTLERHFNADGPYVVTSIQHSGRMNANYRSGAADAFEYRNTFTCIPAALPYRPLRTTRKPVVDGTQTAVVVGPAGEEIFTDKYSRVKVQFHWDREGKNNADSSCWVRVSTLWAGKQWGVIHIPRIGQEVIVDFLEGDPDQPIIMGSVYNADQMPPYGLPGSKTQSGIKSRSSLQGSPVNYNEIRFEDKKGSELVTVHAEKDQSIEVEHDEAHWVGHDRKKTIDHDETTHVKHDRTETVDNNETITVHGQRKETVDKNETITIHQNRTETVDQNETISVGGSRTRTVSKNETVTVTLMRTHTVGINEMINVGAAQEITVGAFQTITVGAYQAISTGAYQKITVGADQTVSVTGQQTVSVGKDQNESVTGSRGIEIKEDDKLKVGKVIAVEAGKEIGFKVGKASLVMQDNGTIQIEGVDITIKGSGQITIKADKDIVQKGKNVLQN